MTFHNHLHEHTDDTEDSSNIRYIIVLGIFGMVFSFTGNVKQTYEMYPLFLYTCSTEAESSSLLVEYNFYS